MTRPQILQFGSSGQVAREIIAQASRHGFSVRALSRSDADLRDLGAIERAIDSAPESTVAVVNAAAYTAVDAAEDDEATAFAVNATAPAVMAQACAKRGLPFVHFSTDYVFDGTLSRPYVETDPVAPLGVYGNSKLAGERAILDALPTAVILRTAWVFSTHGSNFVKSMLKLGAERDRLAIVADQSGCPTPASEIANTAIEIVAKWQAGTAGPGGIYHFAGDMPVSWKEFADSIFSLAGSMGRRVPEVAAISTDEYPTRARRPANSMLNCDKLQKAWGIGPADWRAALARDVQSIIATELGKQESDV